MSNTSLNQISRINLFTQISKTIIAVVVLAFHLRCWISEITDWTIFFYCRLFLA